MLGLVEKLIDPVAGVLDKVIEDKDQKAKLAHEIATMSEKLAAENAALQAKANLEAAKHPSLFVAGALSRLISAIFCNADSGLGRGCLVS